MANNIQNCMPCKQFNHWIEIRLVDEQAKPFNGTLKGTLRDNSGSSHTVTFQNGYLLQTGLSAGPVHITIPTENLLKAAYTHAPREAGKASPVPDFAKTEQGYENSTRQYQNITVGDIWLRAPETMPERHKPQATGKKLKLVADNSYVLEVRAFNMLTVRIGMFFDGTGNNSFNAEAAKKETYDWTFQCSSPEQKTALSAWCGKRPAQGSADNEITNVQKLHALYMDDGSQFGNTLLLKQYIEGIGTTNDGHSSSPTNDDGMGLGLGVGDTGVDAKVKKGCEAAVNRIAGRIPQGYDGIGCFQFDVFGFSRGAAAARHFTNQVIKGEDGYFCKVLKETPLVLADPFDWKNPQQCQFTFVGIFDTVAAIADDLDAHNQNDERKIRLAVPSAQTKRLVHLTAADEFRYNFSLNQINPAADFSEYSVPGAHSDLGGGYYSRYYLDEHHPERMDKALYSEIIIAAFASTLIQSQDIQSTSAWKKASDLRNTLIRQGWGNSQQIVLESATIKKTYYYQIPAEDLMVRVVMKRVVEGDLSRIYLRAMYGFAKYAHVPLRQFDASSAVHKVAPELTSLADSVLAQAQQNRLVPELLQSGNINRAKYIHYSAEIGTIAAKVIHPNAPADNNYRSVYPCREYSS